MALEHHRTWRDAFNEAIREWKKNNPDWQIYLENPPSPNDSPRIRQQRQESYRAIAGLILGGMQRKLNVRRLPHNPNRAHWEEFFHSELITMSQHARGQYLPFHKEMEQFMVESFEHLDAHLGYRCGDGIAHIKDHVENWFHTYVRQPAEEALASIRRRQDKRA